VDSTGARGQTTPKLVRAETQGRTPLPSKISTAQKPTKSRRGQRKGPQENQNHAGEKVKTMKKATPKTTNVFEQPKPKPSRPKGRPRKKVKHQRKNAQSKKSPPGRAVLPRSRGSPRCHPSIEQLSKRPFRRSIRVTRIKKITRRTKQTQFSNLSRIKKTQKHARIKKGVWGQRTRIRKRFRNSGGKRGHTETSEGKANNNKKEGNPRGGTRILTGDIKDHRTYRQSLNRRARRSGNLQKPQQKMKRFNERKKKSPTRTNLRRRHHQKKREILAIQFKPKTTRKKGPSMAPHPKSAEKSGGGKPVGKKPP